MDKYIIEYKDYNKLLELLGDNIAHTNLVHVSIVIVDLTTEQYEKLNAAGVKITRNAPAKQCAPVSPFPAYFGVNPSYINQYYGATAAQAAGVIGTGVKVGIIDSGVTTAIAGAIPGIVRIDYTGLGLGDANNHGGRGSLMVGQVKDNTNNAITVNAGIAYGCQIHNIRAIEGGFAAMIQGINYCIANGIHIINFSLETSDGTLTTAINAALAAGIIVVCASGNDAAQPMVHPANIPGVISCNSVDCLSVDIGGSYLTENGKPKVTIVNYNGGHFQAQVGGTSEACFLTTGYLALMKQKYPTLNSAKAINLLKRKAVPIDGYSYDVKSTTLGIADNYITGAGLIGPIYQ